jgi:hypothetical protein
MKNSKTEDWKTPHRDQVTSEMDVSDFPPSEREGSQQQEGRSFPALSDPNTSRKLCNHCEYIFDHWEEVLDNEYLVKFLHCESIFALQISVARGCTLCAQFLRSLASRGEADILRETTIDLLNKGIIPQRSWIRIASLSRIMSRQDAVENCLLLELRFYLDGIEEEDLESESSSDSAKYFFNEVSCRVAGKVVMIPAITSRKA